jgi:hypothetical protein
MFLGAAAGASDWIREQCRTRLINEWKRYSFVLSPLLLYNFFLHLRPRPLNSRHEILDPPRY